MKGLQEMHLAKLRRPHRTGIKSVSTACKTSTITLYYSPPPQPQDWLLILQIVLPLNSKCFPTSMPTSNLVWLNHTHTPSHASPQPKLHPPHCQQIPGHVVLGSVQFWGYFARKFLQSPLGTVSNSWNASFKTKYAFEHRSVHSLEIFLPFLHEC